jgi:hypothetical protein
MPLSSSQSSKAPGHPGSSETTGRAARPDSSSATPAGTPRRTRRRFNGLCTSMTSGGCSRSTSSSSARIDSRRIGDRELRPPGRCGEVPIEIDAPSVLPRAREQTVGIYDRRHNPGRLLSGDLLEQTTNQQCGQGLFAVERRGQQATHRPVSVWKKRSQTDAVQRAAVLQRLPALERVSEHGANASADLQAIVLRPRRDAHPRASTSVWHRHRARAGRAPVRCPGYRSASHAWPGSAVRRPRRRPQRCPCSGPRVADPRRRH